MHFSTTRFLEIAKMVAVPVLMIVPGGAEFGPMLVAGIGEVQRLRHAETDVPLSGAEKKDHLMVLLRDGVAALNVAKPGTVDPALLDFAAGSAIDVIVDTAKRLALIEAQHAQLAAGDVGATSVPL